MAYLGVDRRLHADACMPNTHLWELYYQKECTRGAFWQSEVRLAVFRFQGFQAQVVQRVSSRHFSVGTLGRVSVGVISKNLFAVLTFRPFGLAPP